MQLNLSPNKSSVLFANDLNPCRTSLVIRVTLNQLLLALLVFLSGSGLVAIMVIAHKGGNRFYYSGLILVIIFAYTILRLRFFYATAAAWAVMALYEITTLWVGPPALSLFLFDNFIFVSANLLGMFSCYHAERSARKDFIHGKVSREEEAARHLRGAIPAMAGAYAQDGGLMLDNLSEHLPEDEQSKLEHELFLS